MHLEYFNKLTVCTERSHKSKGGHGKLFLSVEVQILHTLLLSVVVDVGPFEVLVVWHEFQVWPVFHQ